MQAAYLSLHAQGELQKRVEQARSLLSPCRLCPRQCGVDRFGAKKLGLCQTGDKALVCSYQPLLKLLLDKRMVLGELFKLPVP